MAETKGYRQFSNKQCEFFPCHKDADPENFSCLFCYCPLYPLKKCGGTYTYVKGGIKDCSNCTMPHDPANYDKMMEGCGRVCRRFRSPARQRLIRAAVSLAIAALMTLVCLLLPSLLLGNAWRIADALDIPEIADVLGQLSGTKHTPGYIPAAVCGIITFLLCFRLYRNKLIAALLILLVFVICLPAALLLTESNGVPVYTIVRMLLEYVQLGAI